MNILITGGSGFVGINLAKFLKLKKFNIIISTRGVPDIFLSKILDIKIYNIEYFIHNYEKLNFNIDIVINLGSEAELTDNSSIRNNQTFLLKNFNEKTYNFLFSLKSLKKFIHLSSSKVNSEYTEINDPLKISYEPNPQSNYGKFKKFIEDKILYYQSKYKKKTIIIRSPLIYGPNVKGNFLKLIELIDKNYPLPIKNINNLRSFIFSENLSDFIYHCINNRKLSNKIFFISDDNDISTPNLILQISKLLKKDIKLFSFNLSILKLFLKISGNKKIINSMLDSFQLDINDSKKILNWEPPYSIQFGLSETIKHYKNDN